jgi:hypothetical protein
MKYNLNSGCRDTPFCQCLCRTTTVYVDNSSQQLPSRRPCAAIRIGLSILFGLAPAWPAASRAEPAAGGLTEPRSAPATVAASPTSCSGRYSLFHPEPRGCAGPIDTDRPHLTDTPHTVPPGHFQLETEVMRYGTARGGDGSVPSSVELMEFLFKVGFLPGMDLQVGYSTVALEQSPEGWSARVGREIYLRAKLNLFGLHGRASLTLAPVLLVPAGGDSPVQGGASLLFGAELPAGLDLEVNLIAVTEPREDHGRRLMFAPCAALTRAVYGPLSAFVETYHELRYSAADTFTWLADTGVLVALGQNAQVDAGFRFGIAGLEHPVTLFLGFSFMI